MTDGNVIHSLIINSSPLFRLTHRHKHPHRAITTQRRTPTCSYTQTDKDSQENVPILGKAVHLVGGVCLECSPVKAIHPKKHFTKEKCVLGWLIYIKVSFIENIKMSSLNNTHLSSNSVLWFHNKCFGLIQSCLPSGVKQLLTKLNRGFFQWQHRQDKHSFATSCSMYSYM